MERRDGVGTGPVEITAPAAPAGAARRSCPPASICLPAYVAPESRRSGCAVSWPGPALRMGDKGVGIEEMPWLCAQMVTLTKLQGYACDPWRGIPLYNSHL